VLIRLKIVSYDVGIDPFLMPTIPLTTEIEVSIRAFVATVWLKVVAIQ
jgi:hypothetical protein